MMRSKSILIFIVVILCIQDSSSPPFSAAQSLDGSTSHPQRASSSAAGVQPVVRSAQPAAQVTPSRQQSLSQRISVGEQPGTSGLSRSEQQERRTPARRPAAEDFLPDIAARYQKSLELASEIVIYNKEAKIKL
ncbi:hypothetical protein V5799_006609 [Amblyomma americanum]|uniref:Secreted protein n=1 Tax=Amblyomma americanum TaxID=6943 RepID=A0AAQ4DVX3_AMBAM